MKAAANDIAPRVGETAIDAEHDLQLQLLDSLVKALEQTSDFAPVKRVLEQFVEFSDMHFLSEQLVMRLHHYPAYESHLQEHTRLMKKVREIRETVFRGERKPSLELIHELREWLLSHIASEDMPFGEFLKQHEGAPK